MKRDKVRLIALKDITDSMNGLSTKDENGDVWLVTAYRVDSKEQRRLNKELGISKINYFGNNNGLKND